MGKNEENVAKNPKNKKCDGKNKKSLKRRRSQSRSHSEVAPINADENKQQEEKVIIDVTINVENKDDKPIELKSTRSTQTQDTTIEPKKIKLEIENDKTPNPIGISDVLELPKIFGKTSNLNYKSGEIQTDGQGKRDTYNVYTAQHSTFIYTSESNINEDSAYEPTWKPTMGEAIGYNKGNVPKAPLSRRLIYKYEEKYETVSMPNEDEAKPRTPDVPNPQFKSGKPKRRCSIL